MKKILKIMLVIIFFSLIFVFVNILVRPKYETSLIEGSLIRDYYDSVKDHDVIILGDCEVYANYSPMEMYKQDGIKAYVRGSSQQMLWQSYYILKETLNYETPKLVVFSVGALRNGIDKNNEAYNRLAIDYMRWSKEKVDIINASMTTDESFLSYVFPVLRYHDRITELSKEDFDYLFKSKVISYNGFIMNKDIVPVKNLPLKRKLNNYNFDEVNLEYLDKIVKLCKKNNIKLLLVKSPSLYPYWYDEYDEFVTNYAKENDIDYLNLLDLVDTMGIDFSKDTYDGGLHLNLSGAIKNTQYFSTYIKNKYNLKDYSNDSEYDKLLLYYEEMKK